MGDFNTPSQVTVDPTPVELQPLQQALAQRLMGGLSAGRVPSPSLFPGQQNAFQQLFGPVSAQTGSGQQNQFTNQFLPATSGEQALSQFTTGFQPDVLQQPGGTRPRQGEQFAAGPGQMITETAGLGFLNLEEGGGDPDFDDPDSPRPGGGGGGGPDGDNAPGGGGGGGVPPTPQTPSGEIPLDASLDLPGFQNVFDPGAIFGAPLTGGQLDALSGFRNLFDPSQIVTNAQQSEAVQEALAGNQIFDPSQGTSLLDTVRPFDVRSDTQGDLVNQIINSSLSLQGGQAPQLPGNFQGAFGQALSGQPVDVSGVQQAGRQAFESDLDEIIARERESASAFGLNPGAFDRSRGVIEGAGRAASQFNLGQEQLGLGALENAAQRQLGAVSQGANFLGAGGQANLANARAQNIGTQNLLSLLPNVQQGDQSAFSNFLNIAEPAAQRTQQTLGMLPTFSNLPFQQAQGLFDIGEQARTVADTEIGRRMQEFGRTQGGALNQILALFGNSFPQSTGFGPSPFSQVANLGGSVANALF